MTPHYLAGETAKIMGLTLELARNRTGDRKKAWLNGYAQAMPLQAPKDWNRGRVLPVIRRP